MKSKLPWAEWVDIWLDRYARGIYPTKIYNDAAYLITLNSSKFEGKRPNTVAIMALYISCAHNRYKLDLNFANRIHGIYDNRRWKTGIKSGVNGFNFFKDRAKLWKLGKLTK